jgi:TupA-like ATPgrasp
MTPVFYSSLRLYCRLGYWPRIKRPESLNEKVLHRNLFQRDSLFALVSDKYKVRGYVEEKVGEKYLNELLFITQNPDEIPFDDLPEKYAIKANHGCSWNIIVDGTEPVDREQVKATCREWLSSTYGLAGYETMYEEIEPYILIEKYIETPNFKAPHDYKFYCFHGKVKCIQYQIGRFQGFQQTFYDENWKALDLKMRIPMAEIIDRPPLYDEMFEIAEKLSADFDFARVDLYSPDDKYIVFGEITLSPGSGGLGLEPRKWDWKLGAHWNID